VGRALAAGVPEDRLLSVACPAIHPDREALREYFRMLEQARIGAVARDDDGEVAAAPDAAGAGRR
jgi:hypothetical protein